MIVPARSPAELNSAELYPVELYPAEHLSSEPDSNALTEDLALALLQNSDASVEVIEQIVKNAGLLKSRKVRLALALHPRSPRRLCLRLIREFYTADLVRFALLPAVPADLKHAAARLLVIRLPSITLGERISLARRAPATVLEALLLDKESRVWQAALENPRLTEAELVKVLHRPQAPEALIACLCRHPQWSHRPEIQAGLLLNEKTPFSYALAFVHSLPPAQVRDILHVSRLPFEVKTCLKRAISQTLSGKS
ncbi:MAG TPA: hypothetical protein VI386_30550 [Candidatus Sulfotelmatobacter sp.]